MTQRWAVPTGVPQVPEGPRTLVVDCGGGGFKAAVLDAAGTLASERVRVPTPYPCPTDVFLTTIRKLAEPLGAYDRVSIGVPGVLRHGRVKHTPHYVTVAGPFTAQDPALVEQWRDFDVQAALADELGRPVRAVNDAEMAGHAVITNSGFEVMITLGTGFGFAMFDEGRVLPKIEMSAHLLREGESYDQRLGEKTRERIGLDAWNERMADAIYGLRWVFWWDRLYIGGGNARHIRVDLGPDVTLVPNVAALLGGTALWDDPAVHESPPHAHG